MTVFFKRYPCDFANNDEDVQRYYYHQVIISYYNITAHQDKEEHKKLEHNKHREP